MNLIRLDESNRGDVPEAVKWLVEVAVPKTGEAYPNFQWDTFGNGPWMMTPWPGKPSDGSFDDDSNDYRFARPAEPHEIPAGEPTPMARIIGKWPGDETDEEVAAALKDMDRNPLEAEVAQHPPATFLRALAKWMMVHGIGSQSDHERLVDIANGMEWRPIATAPKDGTEFLATANFDGVWDDMISWWDANAEWFYGNPSHWRPLPAPPQEGE